MASPDTRRDARRALLERLIDHAPLFPPASLPLEEALAEDRRARAADGAWLVGRFVCPATRLAELGEEPRPLSVVLDDDAPVLDDPRIEALEAPPGFDPELVAGLAPEVYAEIPLKGEFSFALSQLQALGLRAKVRCGGEVVPSVSDLALFVSACRRLGIAFKATAGLHHAVRDGEQHGFLNLLAAAAFGDEEAALAEQDASAFGLADDEFRWRDHNAGPDELWRVRRELFVSFGSCSAQEPIDELSALGFLG
jgi:hypothetical protein